MRVRTVQLRLVAGGLLVLWATTATLVLVGYRPGGPIDALVGLAAWATVPVAGAAVVWPPVARSARGHAALVWLALGTALVLIPSIGGVLGQLLARGPQTLLPSLEAAYPWALAFGGTALFSGLGLARRLRGAAAPRGDRIAAGGGIALAALLIVGGGFATAALVNDRAVRETWIAGSRFGPTDPSAPVPTCDGPLVPGPRATVTVLLDGAVDRHSLGSARVVGVRGGTDFRWTARVETDRTLGLDGAAKVGERRWRYRPDEGWQRTVASLEGEDLDAGVVRAALGDGKRATAEDRGIETVEGARARHCRIAIDGPTFAAAFPGVAWFTLAASDLPTWRGELDYWVFLDGQLGRASGSIGGPALEAGHEGLLGSISATLDAIDRDLTTPVEAPD